MSDREFDIDCPPPPPLEKHKRKAINEPSKDPCDQQSSPHTLISGARKFGNTLPHGRWIFAKFALPPQDPTLASYFLQIITPRALNNLNE